MEQVVKLLFPVELSGASPMIVPEVISMAERLNAEIHLLFVVDSLEQYTAFYVPHPSLDQFEEELQRGAERKLEEFEQEFLPTYPAIKRAVRRGDPAEEILKYIGCEGIDFVILATHGRKGLDRIIFGSVADYVVKNSPVPIMSVNPYRTVEGKRYVEQIGPWQAGFTAQSGSVAPME